MKPLALLAFAAFAALAPAAEFFPGLRQVLTPDEWRRAGLDRLTPDEIGVIDAALIRQQGRLPAAVPARVAATTAPTAAVAPAAAAVVSAPPAGAPATARPTWRERFGLGKGASEDDWRNQPPLVAKVVSWQGANGFVLDNGQVWEGQESIPFELPGRTVSIEARPMGAFALRIGEQAMTVRVRRVR